MNAWLVSVGVASPDAPASTSRQTAAASIAINALPIP